MAIYVEITPREPRCQRAERPQKIRIHCLDIPDFKEFLLSGPDLSALDLETLLRDYADRVLPVTAEVTEEWGRMNVPDPVPVVDGLMAATAKAKGLTLATRNTADVERSGVRLLNPFET